MTLVAKSGKTVNSVIHSFMESGNETATVRKKKSWLQFARRHVGDSEARWKVLKLRFLAMRLNGKFGVSQTLDIIKNTSERHRVS